MLRFLLIAMSCIAIGYWFVYQPEIVQPPGVLVPEEPQQTTLHYPKSWNYNDYRIIPLATFHIRARVLGKERYRMDRGAELASYDLALGWQAMSDSALLDKIEVSQSNRWYYLSWAEAIPLHKLDVFYQSANMHLVPATRAVWRAISNAAPGNIIVMDGYLIRAEGDEDWHWQSSLSRGDTGDHSCELVWVEKFTVEPLQAGK